MYRPRAFSPVHLGAWVLLYAACAAVPAVVLRVTPAEQLNHVLPGDDGVTVRIAAAWFPRTMAVAAAVTLLVGLTFGLGYTLFAGRTLSPSRSACGVVGIVLIVGGIVAIWLSIADDHLADRINLIVAAIGSGIGVATGGMYHSEG